MANQGGDSHCDMPALQDYHPPGHISFASSHPGKKPFERIQVTDKAGNPIEQMLWPDHCVSHSHLEASMSELTYNTDKKDEGLRARRIDRSGATSLEIEGQISSCTKGQLSAQTQFEDTDTLRSDFNCLSLAFMAHPLFGESHIIRAPTRIWTHIQPLHHLPLHQPALPLLALPSLNIYTRSRSNLL